MDVTPQTLREVEFREKMRGYHPEDVDAFLERVADGIEVLQERLRQAMERVARAEQQAAEAGGSEETMRKTLLLAQRTADLAVQEAREQASRILAGAEQQAQAALADAEERVRRTEQEAQAGLRADVARLEAARAQLQDDVDALTRWLEEQKGQLGSALEDAMGRIRQLGVAREAPEVKDVDVPAPTPPRSASSARSTGATTPDATASAAPKPQRDQAELTVVGARNGGTMAAPAAEVAVDLGAARPAEPQAEPALVSTPAGATQDNGGGRAGVDPFLAELRRAVDERGPLGPRDATSESSITGQGTAITGLYDQSEDDERPSGGRLFRRR